MRAFEFGRLLQKVAVGPEAAPMPARSEPDFGNLRTRFQQANLSPEAWQHAGLQPQTPEQIGNWSTRQTWEATEALRKAGPGKLRGTGGQDAIKNYNRLFSQVNSATRNTAPPVFAQQGSPGYRQPSLAMNAPHQPAGGPQQPRGVLPGQPQPQPQPQPRPQPRPMPQQQPPGPPRGVVPGQPLPTSGQTPLAPGYIRNDKGDVAPMSPRYIEMMQKSKAREAAGQ